jgi:hypothetical protein
MRQLIRHSAVVFALVAALAACGSTTYKGLTKAEFLRRANENCAHPSNAGKAARKLIAVQTVPARKAKLYLDRVLPLFDREIGRIAALKPPKADRDRVDKILEQARADAKKFTAYLKDDPTVAFSPALRPFKKSGDLAMSYGLRICID